MPKALVLVLSSGIDGQPLRIRFKVPKLWKSGPVSRLKGCYVESHNKKHGTNLTDADIELVRTSRGDHPLRNDFIIEACLAPKDELRVVAAADPQVAALGQDTIAAKYARWQRFDNAEGSAQEAAPASLQPQVQRPLDQPAVPAAVTGQAGEAPAPPMPQRVAEDLADAAEERIMVTVRAARQKCQAARQCAQQLWTADVRQAWASAGWALAAARMITRLFSVGFIGKELSSMGLPGPPSVVATLRAFLVPTIVVEDDDDDAGSAPTQSAVGGGGVTGAARTVTRLVDAAARGDVAPATRTPTLEQTVLAICTDKAVLDMEMAGEDPDHLVHSLRSVVLLHPEHVSILEAWLKNLRRHWHAAFAVAAARVISARVSVHAAGGSDGGGGGQESGALRSGAAAGGGGRAAADTGRARQ